MLRAVEVLANESKGDLAVYSQAWSAGNPLRRRSVALVILSASLVSPSLASATNICGATYSPSSFSRAVYNATWIYSNDSYDFYAYPTWNSTHRNGIQNYVSQGYRYTQEFHDQHNPTLADNLNAFGSWYSSFPDPAFDTDDDDSDGRKEEAEVTARASTFPYPDYQYFVRVRYSRFYPIPGGRSNAYDSDAGYMGHISQISYIDGEWQAYRYCNSYYPTYYSANSSATASDTNAVQAASTTDDHEHVDEVIGPTAGTVEFDGITATVVDDGEYKDVVVNSPEDLGSFKVDNDRRARGLLGGGRAVAATITLSHRLQPPELNELLTAAEVEVVTFEANGSLPDGHTVTVGGPTASMAGLADEFASLGVDDYGIVAATVSLRSNRSFDRLAGDERVFLVDVSAEALRRGAAAIPALRDIPAPRLDIQIDDVYWEHAGLTR